MSNSVSNTKVSMPAPTTLNTDVFMNGFAWSSEGGLFITTDSTEILLDRPRPKIELSR